jgi:hypothetical protein
MRRMRRASKLEADVVVFPARLCHATVGELFSSRQGFHNICCKRKAVYADRHDQGESDGIFYER